MGPEADQHMQMVRHGVYAEHFMIMISHDARDILVEPGFPFRVDECLSVLYGEDDVEMDLSVGVSHDDWKILYDRCFSLHIMSRRVIYVTIRREIFRAQFCTYGARIDYPVSVVTDLGPRVGPWRFLRLSFAFSDYQPHRSSLLPVCIHKIRP